MLFLKKFFRKSSENITLSASATSKWENFSRWGGIFSLCLILSLSLATRMLKPKYGLEIGDISPQDIKAPRTFPIEDRKATREEEKKAIEQVLRVYSLDRSIIEQTKQQISSLINRLQQIDISVDLYENEMGEFNNENSSGSPKEKRSGAVKSNLKYNGISEKIKRFRKENKLNLSDRDLETLFFFASPENYQMTQKIEQVLTGNLKQIYRKGVIKNKAELIEAIKPKTSVYLKRLNKIDEKPFEVSRFYNINEALAVMKEKINDAFAKDNRELALTLNNLVRQLVKPNLHYDLMATRDLMEAARLRVTPVMMTFKDGQMIVREGDQVTEEQAFTLKALSNFQTRTTIKVMFGRSLWAIFLVFIGILYLHKFYPKIYSDSGSLLLLGLVTFFLVPVARGLIVFKVSPYFLPVAVCPILISIIFEAQLALPATVLLIAMLYPIIPAQLQFVSYALVGSMIAIINTSQLRKRDDLTKAGLLIGVANVATLLTVSLYADQEFFTRTTMNNAIIGLTNGIMTYFITTGILPALEGIFKITTDIKLIELSDLNRPILRKMALEAPGTYHHSIIVGNLAEAAAEGVNANPLLARVASYYHDIGKIEKSEYFSENNRENSKHTNLSPNMSSLILISHVKEAVELARKHNLPDSIIDIIRQHHGTTLVSFFYQKALKEDEHKTIKRDDFRYPGPKPQSREAAIIMLADSVEATSRSLTKITSTTIRNLVRKTIQTKLEDKQLDSCDLTLKDLRIIASTFERILSAIFHTRIEYPEDKPQEVKEEVREAKWA